MTYKNRLKLALAADVLFIAGLGTVYYLAKTDRMNNFGINLILIVILGAISIAASFYKESGEYKKWRNIWKDPIWQTLIYIVLAVAVIVSIFAFPEFEYTYNLMFLLIMMNYIVRDIRYYRNAVRYGMDNLKDVNELANKYPEARSYINRKQKPPTASEGKSDLDD